MDDLTRRTCTPESKPAIYRSKSTPPTSTRKTNDIFGIIGRGLTEDDRIIQGSRLPTSNQVLRCMMFHTQDEIGKQTKYGAADNVYKQLVDFYEKGNIPMISEIKAKEKIIELLDENKKLRATPLARRHTESFTSKLNVIQTNLEKTFKLWPKNALELLKCEADRAFLRSMETDRIASFAGHDRILHGKVKRRMFREQQQLQFK